MKTASRIALFVAGVAASWVAQKVGLWFPLRWVLRRLGVIAPDWRIEASGRHHAFDGCALRMRDDGRHTWVAGEDLQRAMRRSEAESVQAARHSGHWQRDEAGLLWLRVDAVVARLRVAPDRGERRTQRLRRYLERDVLFPAEMRRRRAVPPAPDGTPTAR